MNIQNSIFNRQFSLNLHQTPQVFLPFKCNDEGNTKEVTELSGKTPTIIPNDCQLRLGNNYSLNMLNPKVHNLLDKKGEISVGTSSKCNMILPNFYNGVTLQHLRIQKVGDTLIASDNSSKTGTKIIPRKEVKAFQVGTKDIKLAQGELGDCYLLATIYALSRTSNGQKLLEKMVSMDKNGNSIVTFKDKNPIKITPSELDSERQTQDKDWACGEIGTKAIERAYAKLIKENSAEANSVQIDKGGFPLVALETLTGIKGQAEHITEDNAELILQKIEQNGLDNQILMCSTPHNGNYGKYRDKKQKFITGHAYAIKNINSKKGTIEIINPHNTKRSEFISFDEFKQIFDFIYTAKI
ncbi:MAG: hypothetical protein E7Z90_00220 [Cyanobacteria bacterium SIG29]|nr:hypothetical protein [Cyanobacteria bacterium SIG29]